MDNNQLFQGARFVSIFLLWLSKDCHSYRNKSRFPDSIKENCWKIVVLRRLWRELLTPECFPKRDTCCATLDTRMLPKKGYLLYNSGHKNASSTISRGLDQKDSCLDSGMNLSWVHNQIILLILNRTSCSKLS